VNSADWVKRTAGAVAIACGLCFGDDGTWAQTTAASENDSTLRVCADPNNLPQSNSQGEGYENKIASALARDLGRKLHYTFFPQRMGFVRNTLRARDETTARFKCDVIIGVPSGYELTATTRPYMRSTYAMLVGRPALSMLESPEDLRMLPESKLQKIHIGIFAQTPAADWILQSGLIGRAVFYPAQSGDPKETVGTIVERDLMNGKIDVAIVWGPIAGFLASRHSGLDTWRALPFPPNPTIRFDYEISMGVRNGETRWKETLDAWISAHRDEITQILTAYHVPLLPTNG
jgi:quinoprotein dehydrogenase-associated probable ABC transporter substrate-binding protein